jgi:hypothetical protein
MNDIMLLPGCLYLQLISASVNMGVDGALTFRGEGERGESTRKQRPATSYPVTKTNANDALSVCSYRVPSTKQPIVTDP